MIGRPDSKISRIVFPARLSLVPIPAVLPLCDDTFSIIDEDIFGPANHTDARIAGLDESAVKPYPLIPLVPGLIVGVCYNVNSLAYPLSLSVANTLALSSGKAA